MHLQAGLADYNFEVNNLIEDLQDGVRLCRLVQILLGDTSILMVKAIPKLVIYTYFKYKSIVSIS